MTFTAMLARFRDTAFESGEFHLNPTEVINKVVVRENVSAGYGVYVISGCSTGCSNESPKVLYIGKAGTVIQDGSLQAQGLRKRLTRKQNDLPRKEYFPQVMRERSLVALHFEWFVTYRKGNGTPPFLAEAELLDAFLAEFGTLPPLNKSA